MNIKKIVNCDIDIQFYILLVMYKNLIINNSNTINTDKIEKSINAFIDELEELFDNRYDIEEKMIVNIIGNIDDISNVSDFLTKDNENIYLNKNVSKEAIEELLKKEFDDITIYNSIMSVIDNSKKIKRILGLTKIRNLFNKIKKLEDKIQNHYNYNNEELLSLLNERNTIYFKILSQGPEFLDICQTEGTSIDNSNPYEEKYPYNIKYDEIYDENDELVYDEDKYSEEEIEFMYSVDESLHDPYMYAIFSNCNLSSSRIEEDLNNLLIKYYIYLPKKNNNEKWNCLLSDDIRENANKIGGFIYTQRIENTKYFFMTYIKKLDELKNVFNYNELNTTKNRLIYLLDDNITNLSNKEKFELEYNRLEYEIANYDENNSVFLKIDDKEELYDIKDFDWWKDISIASIEELFNDDDEILKVKKLALVLTYYTITNDQDIITELKEYSNKNNFMKYASLFYSNLYQKKK